MPRVDDGMAGNAGRQRVLVVYGTQDEAYALALERGGNNQISSGDVEDRYVLAPRHQGPHQVHAGKTRAAGNQCLQLSFLCGYVTRRRTGILQAFHRFSRQIPPLGMESHLWFTRRREARWLAGRTSRIIHG